MEDSPSNNLSSSVQALPETPGVYQFLDANGRIIYIGKAKNLKKRVSSYFVKNHDSGKTRVLVRNIKSIRHIVVETESDALLLENNLVKKYQPRYNVLLKDDKTFPWICIKKERFPRVFYTRNVYKDGSLYFGPYTSVVMVKALLDMIKQLYKLRNCKYNLSQENIKSGKLKVCLEYHIGNCLGPCIDEYSEEQYNQQIEEIRKILKGNILEVVDYMKQLMASYASEMNFEKAQEVKEKLEMIERYRSKSTIVSQSINNVDVFGYCEDGAGIYINFLRVMNGAVIQAHTIEIKRRTDDPKEEIMAFAVVELRDRMKSNSPEIILPFGIEYDIPGVKIFVPKRGDKLSLLELSQRNAKYFMLEKRKQMSRLDPEKSTERILTTIKNDLHLSELPVHMECFDNSNIQGTSAVAACVVFRNAKPHKSDYRKFNIKTVEGPDDFASMEEVITRRYTRLLNENKSLPQLIVIDGGKGQLNSAVKSLEKIGLRGKIAIIGIAKRLEEIYFPGDKVPIYLDKTSETLKVIQQMRNEAHRFGITFHRDKRSREFIGSELDRIKGIGPETIATLYDKFGSVKTMKKSSFDDLADAIGKAKARLLSDYFKSGN